jgi:hypothetical protein
MVDSYNLQVTIKHDMLVLDPAGGKRSQQPSANYTTDIRMSQLNVLVQFWKTALTAGTTADVRVILEFGPNTKTFRFNKGSREV